MPATQKVFRYTGRLNVTLTSLAPQFCVTGITLQNAQTLWRQLLLMTEMNDQ